MKQRDLTFTFKARFYQLGEINAFTRQIWFVMHGYGQLAQYFIKKFARLEEQSICVIAPEGLSRFYLDNLQGSGRPSDRVGATWMTRENRLTDIENYISYLNAIYDALIQNNNTPVTILGFSQGSATASRWALQQKIKFNRLILWAGILPPDMDFETGKEILKDKEVHFVYGTKDPFLNDSRFFEMKMLSEKLHAHVKQHTFEGGHDIHEETLMKFI
ncbi:MAG: alpha/beta hydrolase [Bacteroidota bacterium]